MRRFFLSQAAAPPHFPLPFYQKIPASQIRLHPWFKICTHLLRCARGPNLCGRSATPPRFHRKALYAECRSPPTQGRWAPREGREAWSSHRMPFTTDTRSVGSMENISAARGDPTRAAGIPPLRMAPSFPSVKKPAVPQRSVFIRVHPWFKNLRAPVALRAGTQPVRQECRPSAWPLPSLPFLL